MNTVRVLVLSCLVLAGAMFGGCSAGGAKVQANQTTLGQELMDLDEAHEKGVISDEEYEKAKKNLLKRD